MTTGYLDNFYARLGVPQSATQEEIRTAYHQAARKFHPDQSKDRGSTEVFLHIQEAYETLSNPTKRAEYDQLLPQDINTPKNVAINTIYSRQTVTAMNRPQLLYILLNIMAIPDTSGINRQRQPLNVGLVLDNSTSMAGSRLNAVKDTALEIIQSLRPEDILSVVTFNDRAEIIIPSARNQAINKLQARISIISTSGGTEIGQGLEAGYQQVVYNMRQNYSNHLILITDGRTYGDEELCLNIAKEAIDKGISLHTLGIGDQWNDEFLDELASETGGSCEFAQTSSGIQNFMMEKFGRIQNTYANNVLLKFDLPEYVEMRYAFRLSPDTTSIPVSNSLAIGHIPKHQSLSLLTEFLVQETPKGKNPLPILDGDLTFTIPTAPIPSFSSRITFSRTVSVEPRPEPPPQVLVKAMSHLSLYRMQEMAQYDLKKGDVRKATSRLKNLATQLLSSGEDDLAHTVMLELEHIRSNKIMSEDVKKQIKFGTRALVMDDFEKDSQE
jgi:Ca-activated chloride channel family protein